MGTHVLSRSLIWIVPQEKVSLSMNNFFTTLWQMNPTPIKYTVKYVPGKMWHIRKV